MPELPALCGGLVACCVGVGGVWPAWAAPQMAPSPRDPLEALGTLAPEEPTPPPHTAEPEGAPSTPTTPMPPPGKASAPAPRLPRHPDRTLLRVAVGLAPEAPGSKEEKGLVDRLERSVRASSDPVAQVRRLRAGAADARTICRERRDDLVVEVGYVATRPEPVLLAHDCALDRPLGLRGVEAVDEPELLGVLWDEHGLLIREGARERRRAVVLGPKARGALIGTAAALAIGAAIAIVLVGALREERAVLTVAP